MWGEIEPCIKPNEGETVKSCGTDQRWTHSPDLQVREREGCHHIHYMCSAHLRRHNTLSVKMFDILILKYSKVLLCEIQLQISR